MSTSLTAALQAVPQASAPAAMSAPPAGPTANGFALTLQQLSQQHQPAPPQPPVNAVPTQALSAAGGSAKLQAVQPKQQHNGHASRSESAAHSSRSTSQAQTSSAPDKRAQTASGQTAQHTGKQTKGSDSNTTSAPGQAGNGLPPTIPVLPLSVRMDAAPPSRMTGNGVAASPSRGADIGSHAKSSATGGNSSRPGSNSWQQLLADASLFNTKAAGSGQTGVSAAFTALASVRGGSVTATAGGLPAGPLMQLVATTGQPPSGLAPGIPPPTPGQPGFAQVLNGQVSWMIGQGQQAATLQINPPQLGPLQISVHILGDQTQILFQTHHALVKSALDAATPQLRELLGQGGSQQVSVSVQQQALGNGQLSYGSGGGGGFAQGGGYGAGQGAASAMPFAEADAEFAALPSVGWQSLNRGLIDAYA